MQQNDSLADGAGRTVSPRPSRPTLVTHRLASLPQQQPASISRPDTAVSGYSCHTAAPPTRLHIPLHLRPRRCTTTCQQLHAVCAQGGWCGRGEQGASSSQPAGAGRQLRVGQPSFWTWRCAGTAQQRCVGAAAAPPARRRLGAPP